MPVAVLAALLLLAPPPAAVAAPAITAPAPASASAAAVASATPAPDDAGPTPDGLAELQRAYAQSCEAAIDVNIGAYADVCQSLRDQIGRYRAELQRAQRRKPRPR